MRSETIARFSSLRQGTTLVVPERVRTQFNFLAASAAEGQTSGAKARCARRAFSAWLKPCPDDTARPAQGGLTLVELIVAVALLALLSTVAMPLARVQLRRERERELRAALREMRTAIDRYKDAADRGMIQVELGTEGYPKTLDLLVEGVKMSNSPEGKRLKFLRRVPQDPMTNSTDWGVRSYQDEPDSTSSSGENVFDVYTRSQGTGMDGTKYSEW